MIVISASCFGSLTTLTVLAMRTGLSLAGVIFWRFAISAALLFALTFRSRRTYLINKAALRLVAIGALGQALISYMSFKALDYLPVGVLAFLFYTYPAWVAILSAFRGKERLTRSRLISLGLAMAGITVMVGAPAGHSLNPTGILLALGTAFLYALYLPTLHDAQHGIPSFVSAFYLVIGIAVTFMIVNLATSQFEIPRRPETWGYLLLLAVIGTVVAFGAMIAGLSVLGPVRTSIVSTVEPFFTAVLGAVLLSETLTSATIIGGAMIASAVILLERNSEITEVGVSA